MGDGNIEHYTHDVLPVALFQNTYHVSNVDLSQDYHVSDGPDLPFPVVEDLVGLYLQKIHHRPHSLFHPRTLQQRVRQGRRVGAGARQVQRGGGRAALEKERKSYTFVQSLLQRFSDSEQVHEQLEDMRGDLGEKKAELKQRVQRREGITKCVI